MCRSASPNVIGRHSAPTLWRRATRSGVAAIRARNIRTRWSHVTIGFASNPPHDTALASRWRLSPSMAQFGNILGPSGLSAERAPPATSLESRSWLSPRVEVLSTSRRSRTAVTFPSRRASTRARRSAGSACVVMPRSPASIRRSIGSPPAGVCP